MKRNRLIGLLGTTIILLVSFFPLGLGHFEVTLTALLAVLFSGLQFKKGLFSSLGFQHFNFKAINLLVIAPLVAGLLFAFYYFILLPGVGKLTGQSIDFTPFRSLEGDFIAVLSVIPVIWISAAFGEEIIWRGYLMRQFLRFFGSSSVSIALNILLLGVIFGYMHSYQGITGMIITGIIGMIIGFIYYKRNYDLWFTIAVHGYFDTIALLVLYNGWF